MDFSKLRAEETGSGATAWEDIWSAGQGTGSIRDILPAGELCARLVREYEDACRELSAV